MFIPQDEHVVMHLTIFTDINSDDICFFLILQKMIQ